MEDQTEQRWYAGLIGNGRGLTPVSPRPIRWSVSDSCRQRPSNSVGLGLEIEQSIALLLVLRWVLSTLRILSGMDVHDDWIPNELFEEFLKYMPQVSVELVLETDEGFLVAKRENEPQVWFWPGNRLYKGEELSDAAHRVAVEELDIEVELTKQLGVYEHIWEPQQTNVSEGRHTINVVYHAVPKRGNYEINLDEQHSDFRFIDEVSSDLHKYVRLYLTDNDLL